MATPRTSLARVLIPLVLALASVGVAVAVLVNSSRQGTPGAAPPATPAHATGPGSVAQPEPPQAPAPQDDSSAQADLPAPEASPALPAGEAPGAARALRLRVFQGAVARVAESPPLGSLGFAGDYHLRVEFSATGAGVQSVRMARELDNVTNERRAQAGEALADQHFVELQAPRRKEWVAADGTTQAEVLVPLAAFWIELDGQRLYLTGPPNPTDAYWNPTGATGEFEAVVEDAGGVAVARLVRRYELDPASNDLRVRQIVENLGAEPLRARFAQLGPVDLPLDTLGYGGDKRRLRFGYLADPAIDPQRSVVSADDYLIERTSVLGSMDKASGAHAEVATVWPNPDAERHNRELVWAGLTNRYFGVVAHELGEPDALVASKAFESIEFVERLVLNRPRRVQGFLGESWRNDADMGLSLTSSVATIAPGAVHDFGMGLYVGPLSKPAIRGSRVAEALGIDEIIVYNFGGMCAGCTFSWLTSPLLELLRLLYSLTRDWSLAVILLVVVVRGILHPVTRWSQIRVQRFGKQMQAMAPKQKIVQEKFKNDPQRMREEMAKLWKEEGVSPAGFLGCLPMFLQSPVWIALYATLYFAIELRHEAAFYGLFQAITGNRWVFMGDLAEPDRLIYFGRVLFSVPLMGSIASFNVLPILLGLVFYVHQKYLTPPTSAALTPEQEAQQRMMKIMTVVLFPVFMYNAPSAMALYFITNSTIAIFENRWIKSHIEKHGLLDLEKLKSRKHKAPKPGGFLDRLQKMAAEQQRLREQGARPSAKSLPRSSKPDSTERKFKNKSKKR